MLCVAFLRLGEKIGIDEIVSLDSFSGNDSDGTRKHWSGEGEGVELAALAARIDAGWKVCEQFRIEGSACERWTERARINTSKMRAQACIDHLLGEFGGADAEISAPDRKDRLETGSSEALDAICANVLKEEVAESDSVKAFRSSASANLSHSPFVVGVAAREGKIDLPKRQTDRSGLPIEQLFAEAVNCDPAELFVDRGQQSNDFKFGLLAKEMKRPGAVLAAAPTKEDAFWLQWYPPPISVY